MVNHQVLDSPLQHYRLHNGVWNRISCFVFFNLRFGAGAQNRRLLNMSDHFFFYNLFSFKIAILFAIPSLKVWTIILHNMELIEIRKCSGFVSHCNGKRNTMKKICSKSPTFTPRCFCFLKEFQGRSIQMCKSQTPFYRVYCELDTLGVVRNSLRT